MIEFRLYFPDEDPNGDDELRVCWNDHDGTPRSVTPDHTIIGDEPRLLAVMVARAAFEYYCQNGPILTRHIR